MSKSRPAPLTMPLVPKKGQAAPAVTSFEDATSPPMKASDPASGTTARSSPLASRVQATIAVTVRLDEHRYERMKTWGQSRRRVTNQEIIVAALDRFFALDDAEREELIARVRR